MIETFLPDFVPERVYLASHPVLASSAWNSPEKDRFRKALIQAELYSSMPADADPAAQIGLDQQFKGQEQSYAVHSSQLSNFNEWIDRYGDMLFVHRGADHYGMYCTTDCTILYVYHDTFRVNLEIDRVNLPDVETIRNNFNKFLDSQMKIID